LALIIGILSSSNGILIIGTRDDGGTTGVDSEENLVEFSTRGITILVSLAEVTGEGELSEEKEMPKGFSSKVRDFFSGGVH
jgi:hypothetical protein